MQNSGGLLVLAIVVVLLLFGPSIVRLVRGGRAAPPHRAPISRSTTTLDRPIGAPSSRRPQAFPLPAKPVTDGPDAATRRRPQAFPISEARTTDDGNQALLTGIAAGLILSHNPALAAPLGIDNDREAPAREDAPAPADGGSGGQDLQQVAPVIDTVPVESAPAQVIDATPAQVIDTTPAMPAPVFDATPIATPVDMGFSAPISF